MSELSFMEKLLDGVEVEWKLLGEVTAIKTGQSVNKQMISSNPGEYPVINSGREPLGYIGEWNTDNDPIGITTRGAGVGSVTWQEGKYFRGNLNYSVTIKDKQKLNTRFLYHLLLEMQKEIQDLCTFDGIPALNAGNLKDLQIPIPCPDNPKKSLEIQAEIVRILDAFTAMTAELTAELNLRKKQYNYYRDQLLSFEEGDVEWKTLEEVAHFANGKGHEKDISEDGRYIVVNSKFISTDGGVAKFSNSQICPLYKDDILLVMSDLPNGRALSKTFIVEEDDKYTLNQRIGGITVKNNKELLPKFLHYFLDRTPQLLKHDNGVDQTNLRKGQILEVKVPMISPIKQAQIVEILDKFDTYTKSISEGLPREIELRQKQYEYYRDLLLSFPKPNAEVAA
jgi:type I restriction enzyme S subunit